MDERERRDVVGKLEWEGGLEYLIQGSDFADIHDQKFHKLRLAYKVAAEKLSTYLRLDEEMEEEESPVSLCTGCGEEDCNCEEVEPFDNEGSGR
jgi:hypothetical protein